MQLRDEESRQARLEREKTEVAARLRRFCEGMADDEFNALVSRVAEVTVKYTFRRAGAELD